MAATLKFDRKTFFIYTKYQWSTSGIVVRIKERGISSRAALHAAVRQSFSGKSIKQDLERGEDINMQVPVLSADDGCVRRMIYSQETVQFLCGAKLLQTKPRFLYSAIVTGNRNTNLPSVEPMTL